MSKLARAKSLADEWQDQAEHARYEAAVSPHFDRTSPHQLIAMWETGKNLKGKPLTQFETQALFEAWLRVFGEWPPDEDDSDPPHEPDTPAPELPADDTMLRANDVVRITGVSLSSLKRMVQDKRFPAPMRLSPRRIGWPARDVKAWLDGLERLSGRKFAG